LWYRQYPPVITPGVTLAETKGEPFSRGILEEKRRYVEKDANIFY